MDMEIMAHHWYPFRLISQSSVKNVALIILNMNLNKMPHLLEVLWQKASVKLCCDGGLNRLHEVTQSKTQRFVPDLITGDFDSVDPQLLQLYKHKGSEIVSTPDQDFTDFTKCAQELLRRSDQYQFDSIVAMRSIGSRLDHTLANINTLFTISKLTDKPFYLLDEQSIAFLLTQGSHNLHVEGLKQGDWCAIIPVGSKCEHITTTGLKWNLDNGQLEFGALISTSNTVDGCGLVTIETSHPVLWIMQYCLENTCTPNTDT